MSEAKLGFKIEERAGVFVVVFDGGGVSAATDISVRLWERIEELEAENERLGEHYHVHEDPKGDWCMQCGDIGRATLKT